MLEHARALAKPAPGLGNTGGPTLLPIQARGRREPLYFVHGVAGGMLDGYARLARHLGQEQPVYAFRSRAAEGGEEFPSLQAMAEHYVEALVRFRQGPYRIGGYCFGGNVAYEMACQLHELGHRVEFVGLINASPPNSRYDEVRWDPVSVAKFLFNLYYWSDSFVKWKPSRRRRFVTWKLRKLRERAARWMGLGARDALESFNPEDFVDLELSQPHERALLSAHVRNLVHYRNAVFPGRVTLFRTAGHPMFCSFDRSFGWGDYALGGVDVRMIPGTHECLMDEPNVRALARQVAAALDALEGGRPR